MQTSLLSHNPFLLLFVSSSQYGYGGSRTCGPGGSPPGQGAMRGQTYDGPPRGEPPISFSHSAHMSGPSRGRSHSLPYPVMGGAGARATLGSSNARGTTVPEGRRGGRPPHTPSSRDPHRGTDVVKGEGGRLHRPPPGCMHDQTVLPGDQPGGKWGTHSDRRSAPRGTPRGEGSKLPSAAHKWPYPRGVNPWAGEL